jgi:hypothetical protein
MADWTALAGFAGLAAALENIQDRRLKEAQLQQRLTEGTGEWSSMAGSPGGLGILDQFLGYSPPGQASFGGQRYQFKPYDPVTDQQAQAWGMTYPETTTTPEYQKALPTGVHGPPELVPAQETTRDVAMPGIVGMRLGPREKMALFQEQLKERREMARLEREQELFKGMNVGTFGVGTSLPGGTPLPPDTPGAPGGMPAGTGPAAAPLPTQPPPGQRATAAPAEIETAVQEATRLYPQVRPALVRAVAAQESNFNPRAVSPKGAQGVMQLMPGTAQAMGVVDPFDIRQNVRGGTRYLAQLLRTYGGDEAQALAAYNAGPGAVAKAGGRLGALPAETQAYVPRVLARAREGAPAPASGQPDTSMLVAGGTGAPAPTTSTPGAERAPGLTRGQAPAAPQAVPAPTQPPPGQPPAPPGAAAPLDGTPGQAGQAPFALSLEGRRQILANNKKIERNEEEMRRLDAQQAQVNTAAARLKNPQLAARATQIGQRLSDLSRDNQSMRDASEGVLQKEASEWRTRSDVLAREGRERQLRFEERQRRPEELQREKTAEKTAEEEFRLGQTLQDVQKDEASLFRNPRTGESIDPTLPYRQVLASQKRKVDGMPEAIRITKDQQERLESVESALPRVARIQQYIDQLYGPGGVLAHMTPDDRELFGSLFTAPTPPSKRLLDQFAQKYPELEAARKYVSANAEALARAIAGAKGPGTEGDVQRARDLVANLTAGVTLWPLSRLGLSLPDTRAVAMRTMNDLVTTLEGTTGQMLRNPQFRYPQLKRYEIAQEPPAGPRRPAAPATRQATGLNPAWVQSRLPAMTPAQIREAPPEVMADINRGSDIAGLSTEQRKALAARLRQRNALAVARTRTGRDPGRRALSP